MNVYDADPRRRSRRLKIFTPAQLMQGAETRRIHLLDISRGGALAHSEAPPPRDARVRIQCECLHASAVVAWVAGKRFGLMFSAPIDERMLRGLLGTEAPSVGAFAAKPGAAPADSMRMPGNRPHV